jgi:RimJ/RimL family protein N-acetyltransferase
LEAGDLKDRVRWFNQASVRKGLVLHQRLDYPTTCRWFARTRRDGSRKDFVIETIPDRRPIGAIGFRKLDLMNRSAGFYIVIGESDCLGQGLATEALSLLLRWAWKTLRLHKVWCVVRPTNSASLSLVRKGGFQVEGLLREEACVSGRWLDLVRLGILRTDWIEDGKR